jgi:hypothetical protein
MLSFLHRCSAAGVVVTGYRGRPIGTMTETADEAARLTRLGAELIATHDDRGPLTYVMRDPEGSESCLH